MSQIIHADGIEHLQSLQPSSVDLVVDPMCGSGTTCKMAHLTGRRWLGIDISRKYTDIATRRMRAAQSQQHLEIA